MLQTYNERLARAKEAVGTGTDYETWYRSVLRNEDLNPQEISQYVNDMRKSGEFFFRVGVENGQPYHRIEVIRG